MKELSRRKLQTLNTKLQTDFMEIQHQHHHDHPQHKEKVWKHYTLEFFMLFLAVFSGFLAENFREHQVEKEREKIYMKSMVEDLKTDTAKIRLTLYKNELVIKRVDSLIHLLRNPDRDQYGAKMYFYARVITATYARFELNDRTYEQMKSSGSLRTISYQDVSDSVLKYYSEQSNFKLQEGVQIYRSNAYSDILCELFDGEVFQEMLQTFPFEIHRPNGNPQLLTSDPAIINAVIGRLHYVGAVNAINNSFVRLRINQTTRMIHLLQTKYHFE